MTLAIPFVAQHLATGAKNQHWNNRAFIDLELTSILTVIHRQPDVRLPGHEVTGGQPQRLGWPCEELSLRDYDYDDARATVFKGPECARRVGATRQD
jgi:hypothetical protein